MSVCMGGGMWVWPVVTFYPGCGAQHRVLKINLNVNIAHQAMTRLLFLIFRPIKSGGASGVTSICCCWSYPKPDHSSSFPTAIYVLLIESKIRKCRQEKKNATSFFFFFFLRGKHCLWTHTNTYPLFACMGQTTETLLDKQKRFIQGLFNKNQFSVINIYKMNIQYKKNPTAARQYCIPPAPSSKHLS